MYRSEIMKFGIKIVQLLKCNSASNKKLLAAYDGNICKIFNEPVTAGFEISNIKGLDMPYELYKAYEYIAEKCVTPLIMVLINATIVIKAIAICDSISHKLPAAADLHIKPIP